ncbi:MAG: hypothetical protein SNI70_09140 [Rikenellaceae bacterium]
MTKEDLLEVMELAKKVSAEPKPKKEERGVLDIYVDSLKAKEEKEAQDRKALREFYGLNDNL